MINITKFDYIKWKLYQLIKLLRGTLKYSWRVGWNTRIYCGKRVIIRNIKFLNAGNILTLGDDVEIDALSLNGLKLGDDCSIGRGTSLRLTNNFQNPGFGVVIGNNFSCGDYTFFGANGGICIGDDVRMGQCVRFHAQNHNFDGAELIRLQGTTSKGISIGNNCWIGSGTVFLDGSKVGNGCVVAANSLITKHFPDNVVIMGQPARVVRKRFEENSNEIKKSN